MWIRIIKSELAQSVERLFYKTQCRRFRRQWFFFAFVFSSSFFFYYCHSKLLQSENYKVFIIKNNKLIYLSRTKSCLWGWSWYHYNLAQRPISHRIHMFLATLSIICKCRILGKCCVSIQCASGRGFLFQASATYRSL